MSPTRVPISPDVLRRTRERSGHDDETMRHKFSGWPLWLSGERQPTITQAEELARFTHVPFGVLLLPVPPEATLPIEHFRVGRAPDGRPSQNLLDVIYQSQRRQEWYREYAERNGIEPDGFLTRRAGPDTAPAAAAIRQDLQFEVTDRAGLRDADAARKHLTQAFESLGGLVAISSMVGNSTHRLLDTDEFRGFTLMDETAPLVFVNGADTKFGQVFSLAHEFAHVARGDSGVSAETPTDDGPESSAGAMPSLRRSLRRRGTSLDSLMATRR